MNHDASHSHASHHHDLCYRAWWQQAPLEASTRPIEPPRSAMGELVRSNSLIPESEDPGTRSGTPFEGAKQDGDGDGGYGDGEEQMGEEVEIRGMPKNSLE